MDEPAEHVARPKAARQKAVRPAEERTLVLRAHVLGQRHNNVGHHDRILAHGTLSIGPSHLVHALDAPAHRLPVRLDPGHWLHRPVGGVDGERVVHPDPCRVDVVALQTGRVAPVVGEHVTDRSGLVLLDVSHPNASGQEILAD